MNTVNINIARKMYSMSSKCTKTKKCQPDAGDRPDLIQTAPVPSIGLARQQNINIARKMYSMSSKCTKTKKCQPDAGDRPDLIQTAPVPSIGLARQQKNKLNEKLKNRKINILSHVPTNDLVGSSPVANLLPTSRLSLSKEINSPDSLSVAHKLLEDKVHHPDGKWIKDDVTKTKSVSLLSGTHHKVDHTLRQVGVGVPDSGLARPQIQNKQNEKYIKEKSNYSPNVTLVENDKYTKLTHQSEVPIKTKSVSLLSGTHSKVDHTLRQAGVGVPDSGLARPQTKNKQNEKHINQKSNYLPNVTLVENYKHTKKSYQSRVPKKNKKCQPAVRDTS